MTTNPYGRFLAAYSRWRKKNWPKLAVANPVPIKRPPVHHPLTLEQRIVAYCHTALEFAGKMAYTESALRSELFHRKPGDFSGAHADCSQFGSSILHWLGVAKATATDFTGTMLQKYKHVSAPAPGRGVVFGEAPGVHFGFITEKTGNDWYVVAFGHDGAPDRSALSGLKTYFKNEGHPGVTYLDFS